jgi:molecular chaperone GrpE (heat shock protein)
VNHATWAIENAKPIHYWESRDLSRVVPTIASDFIALMRERKALQAQLVKKDDESKKEIKKLLLRLVAVLDAFDRVFINIESKPDVVMDKQIKIWLGNFKAIKRVVESDLREMGVMPIEAPLGMAVPGLHTIIETRSLENVKDDTILQEMEKGYLWRGEVLRKSTVITAKN